MDPEARVFAESSYIAHGAMKYTIARDTNIVTVVVSDVVTLQDCIRCLDCLLTEAPLEPRIQVLLDATSAQPELSFDDLRELVRHVRRLVQFDVRSIALTATNDFVHGLALIFSAYADIDGLNLAVFRNQRKARKWLATCMPAGCSPTQNNAIVSEELR
jgi:hypothetical protein